MGAGLGVGGACRAAVEELGKKITGGSAVHERSELRVKREELGAKGTERSGRALLLEFEINRAQLVESAVGADFGGADGAFEDAGNFGEREFLETREEQDFTVIAVEAGEGGVEESVVVAGGGAVAGVGRVLGVVRQVGGVGGKWSGVGFAEMVGGAAAGEVIHPRGKTAVVAIGVAVFEHPLENGLGDIFGGGALAGELYEEAEERAVVAFEEFAERVEFTVADGEHKSVVGTRCEGGVHRGSGVASGFNHGWTRMNTDFWIGGDHGGSGTWLGVARRTRRRRDGYRNFWNR